MELIPNHNKNFDFSAKSLVSTTKQVTVNGITVSLKKLSPGTMFSKIHGGLITQEEGVKVGNYMEMYQISLSGLVNKEAKFIVKTVDDARSLFNYMILCIPTFGKMNGRVTRVFNLVKDLDINLVSGVNLSNNVPTASFKRYKVVERSNGNPPMFLFVTK